MLREETEVFEEICGETIEFYSISSEQEKKKKEKVTTANNIMRFIKVPHHYV